MKLELVTDLKCELGEGPVWDAQEGRILWIDIVNGNIHQYYPRQDRKQTFYTGQKTGAIALKEQGGLIAALEHGFASVDLEKQKIKLISEPEAHLTGNRFNDGKCDPAGRFWAGSMSVSGNEASGSLYTVEKDLSVSIKIKNLGCSNGLAWNRDATTFYFIDTPTRQVTAYDYDITDGNISNRRVIITIAEEDGFPDGMTIDSEDMLWIAIWGGWKIERWNPHTGKLLDKISLPVSQVSSCTFGGDNLNEMYITSARQGLPANELEKQPLAGSLFVVKNCGYYGQPASLFNYNPEL